MMRNAIFVSIIVLYLIVLFNRLPLWHSNLTIWVAAVKVEPKDPWVLNNAAHYTHDDRSIKWLIQLVNLNVPKWLSLSEKEPYYIGYQGLSNTLRVNGYNQQASIVDSKLTALIIGHSPIVSYVAK